MNEQELEQVHKSLMQNGATRALKIAGRLGKKVLKIVLQKVLPVLLSWLAPLAGPILAVLLAFVLIYSAFFMLPRWIMGGGSGPINQNTVGIMQVEVTGYTTAATTTGVPPTKGVIAVDPSVIPYGTRMYVPGYGNGIALDSNATVKGNNIEAYFDDTQDAQKWKGQYETIEMLGVGAIPASASEVTTDASSGQLDILSYGNTDTSWPLSKDQQLFKTYLDLDSNWLSNYEPPGKLLGSTPDSSSGNGAVSNKTVGDIWSSWMSQIPSESEQAYPYRVPWSVLAAMDKVVGDQNFIGTNLPGAEGDGRQPDPNTHFNELSPTLTWQTFELTYYHQWTVTVTDKKGNTETKTYTEQYMKNIRLLTSAACYDANYQYAWTSDVIDQKGNNSEVKVTIPQVTLVTRTGPYYEKLKQILAEPEYNLTTQMDLEMVIQVAQSLDQAYNMDSWLFGTPLELEMNTENGTGLTGRFEFMPVANAPAAIPYGFYYNSDLEELAMNPGVDLLTTPGETVSSVAAGTVVFVGNYGSDGNAIMINHGNCRTLYADLESTSVSVGQQVAGGQAIGKVGMPYLHFEVRTGTGETEYLNPANYLPEMVWGTGSQQYVNPQALQYKAVNASEIITFLQGYSSDLADTADVNTIISAAQQYDINPLLLFAITGQEVCLDSTTAYPTLYIEMHDNPFDVYGAYNLTYGEYDLQQTADVAAETCATRLSVAPPAGENAIAWINDPGNTAGNGQYAQDPGWATGVIAFFNIMNDLQGIYGGST